MKYKTDKEIAKEFDKTKFAKEGGSCFECCDYEGMNSNLLDFILSQRHQDREAIREEIEKNKKADVVCQPFNITAEYRLGQLRGNNEVLTDLLSFLDSLEK